MAIFKTKGIILKKTKIDSKEIIYDIFTYDFGRIICQKKSSKKEKDLDLGYIIFFDVYVKKGIEIHKISNITIKNEFCYLGRCFEDMFFYMQFLNSLFKYLPHGAVSEEIFEICEKANSMQDNFKIYLLFLKVLSLSGNLNPTGNENITTQKIYKFISENNLNNILRLSKPEKYEFSLSL